MPPPVPKWHSRSLSNSPLHGIAAACRGLGMDLMAEYGASGQIWTWHGSAFGIYTNSQRHARQHRRLDRQRYRRGQLRRLCLVGGLQQPGRQCPLCHRHGGGDQHRDRRSEGQRRQVEPARDLRLRCRGDHRDPDPPGGLDHNSAHLIQPRGRRPLENMILRAQTHIDPAVSGGLTIKAPPGRRRALVLCRRGALRPRALSRAAAAGSTPLEAQGRGRRAVRVSMPRANASALVLYIQG